jgi:ABC-type multidrug transport system ATPase subunit
VSGSTALELDGVSKGFGRVEALREVSLRVPRGGLFGLLGPNGAGKTTLLSLAAGFLHPDAGEVRVLGAPATEFATLCGRVSLLPQDADFQPGVALAAQLVHFGRLAGLDRSQAGAAARRALEAVRLGDVADRLPRTLSHGMRKRAALAQALLGEPELLFIDEPTAGLDPENARHVRELVRDLGAERTVVLCSHNLHEIQELCKNVAILQGGRVIESGPMAELTGDASRLRIVLHTPGAAAAAEALASLPAVAGSEAVDERILSVALDEAAATDRAAAVRAVLARLLERDHVPAELRGGASLESRFLELTAEEPAGDEEA